MKLKILIITSEFPPLPGGIGNHAFFLSKYLCLSGYNVTVLCDYRSEKEDVAFDKNQDFEVFRISRNRFTYINRIRKGVSLARRSSLILASGKFSLWLAAFLSLFFKQKYVAVLHGSEIRAGGVLAQRFTTWSLGRFHRIIAVSAFTKDFALQIRPELTIDVINNGIELNNYIAPVQRNIKALKLVTVGNLTCRKGQQNVIRALPLLKEHFPDMHYHCVGIPTQKQDFYELAQSLGVTANVTFHGALSNIEKDNVLSGCTVFIMLSDRVKNDFEGFGIAILEANHFGLPAIGSANSGIADAIKDGYSGVLVNPHNPEEILSALEEIMSNYQTYSDQAQEWVTRFEWRKIIREYTAVIEA